MSRTAARTTSLDVRQAGLPAAIEHALRDRQIVHVYGPDRFARRFAAALLTAELRSATSTTVRRDQVCWVIKRAA
jgi:hypothetical protein